MRGEVYLLSRNVIIRGNDVDQWGCQIVTSTFNDQGGVVRSGSTLMDNVEITNCSQYGSLNAAIRFDNTQAGTI